VYGEYINEIIYGKKVEMPICAESVEELFRILNALTNISN